MDFSVSDYTAFADIRFSRLELGLYQNGGFTVFWQKLLYFRENMFQRHKRNVRGNKGQFFRKIIRRKLQYVCFFHIKYTAVVYKLIVKLTVTDVHRVNILRTVLQHTIGKAACGRAYVYADPLREVYPEYVQSLFKLQAASANVAELTACNFHGTALINVK